MNTVDFVLSRELLTRRLRSNLVRYAGIKLLLSETGSGQHAHLDSLTATLNSLIATTDALNDAAAKVHEAGSLFDEAKLCQSTLLPLMEDARAHADKLEGLCDADLWPMPNYHEMLFHQA